MQTLLASIIIASIRTFPVILSSLIPLIRHLISTSAKVQLSQIKHGWMDGRLVYIIKHGWMDDRLGHIIKHGPIDGRMVYVSKHDRMDGRKLELCVQECETIHVHLFFSAAFL